jgi:hypothetical protein
MSLAAVVQQLAPTGVLRVGINLSNALLVPNEIIFIPCARVLVFHV